MWSITLIIYLDSQLVPFWPNLWNLKVLFWGWGAQNTHYTSCTVPESSVCLMNNLLSLGLFLPVRWVFCMGPPDTLCWFEATPVYFHYPNLDKWLSELVLLQRIKTFKTWVIIRSLVNLSWSSKPTLVHVYILKNCGNYCLNTYTSYWAGF